MATNSVNIGLGIDDSQFLSSLHKDLNDFTKITRLMETAGQIKLNVKAASTQKIVSDFQATIKKINKLKGTIGTYSKDGNALQLFKFSDLGNSDIATIKNTIKTLNKDLSNVRVKGGVNNDMNKTIELLQKAVDLAAAFRNETNKLSMVTAKGKDSQISKRLKEYERVENAIAKLKANLKDVGSASSIPALQKQLSQLNKIANTQRSADASLKTNIYAKETKSIEAEIAKIEEFIAAKKREAEARKLDRQLSTQTRNYQKAQDRNDLVAMRNAKNKEAAIYESQYNRTGDKSARVNAEAARAEVAAIQQKIEIQKKATQERKQAIALETKAKQIEATISSTGDKSISDLKRRVTLSNQLVETYKKLQQLTGVDYSKEINRAKNTVDPVEARYSRDSDNIKNRIDVAKQNNDLEELRKAQLSYARLNERMAGYSGNDTYRQEAKSAREAARATQELIESKRKEAKIEQEKLKALNKLKFAEQDYAQAQRRNIGKNVAQYNSEIMALQKLIAAKRQYLRASGADKNAILNNADIKRLQEQLLLLRQNKDALLAQNRAYSLQKTLLGSLRNLATRYFGLYAVINFAKKMAETLGYFQQQRVALEAITQDVQKANTIFKQLQDFSVKSPFQFKQLVSFTKQLSAFRIPTDELFDTTKKLADISAGLGVDMQRIILAYGQVRAAAVLRGQELRQFTEAGIPLVDELAKKFSVLEGRVVSTGEVFKRISERQVSFEMVKEILFSMTEEGGRFNEMQEKLSKTTYGQLMNLKDAWSIALNDIGQSTSGIINGTVRLFRSMIDNWRTTLSTIMGFLGGTAINVIIGKIIAQAATLKISLKGISDVLKVIRISARRAGGALKSAFISTGIGALLTAVGFLVGRIIETAHKAKELKRTLDEIDRNASSKITGLVNNFGKLTKALQSAAEGSEEERIAYEKLLQTYSEYLPKQDLELENLRNLTDGYNKLTSAIIAKVRAQAEEEKRDSVMQKVGDDIDTAIDDNILKVRRQMSTTSGKSINLDIIELLADDIKQAITENITLSNKDLYKVVFDVLKKYNLETTFSAKEFVDKATRTRNKYPQYFGMGGDNNEAYKAAFEQGYRYNSAEFNAYVELYRKLQEQRKKTNEAVRDEIKTEGTTLTINKTKTANKTILRRLRDAEMFEGAIRELNLLAGTNIDPSKVKKGIEGGIYDRSVIVPTVDKYINREKGRFTDPAVISLLESISTTLQENLTLYEKYEDNVNGYLDDLVKSGSLNNGLSPLYNKFYMSPQTNLTEYVKTLQTEYDAYKQHFEKQLEKDPAKIADKTLSQKVTEDIKGMEYLKMIAKYLNIDLDANKTSGGRGGNSQERAYNVFTSLFSLIKEGRKEMTELVGLKGYTGGFKDVIDTLDSDSILKQFMQEGKNPFANILKELSQDGALGSKAIEQELYALRNKFKETGELSFPDFQSIWEDLENTIANQLSTLTKNNGDGKNNADIRRWSEMLTRFKKEGDVMFSRDKLDTLISNAVKELKLIESNTEDSARKLAMFESLSKVMRFDEAYRLVYNTEWDSNESKFAQGSTWLYQEQVLQMLRSELNGIGTEFAPLIQVLESAKMDVSNLHMLMGVLSDLNTQKGNIPEGFNDEEFTKIIDNIIKAFENLISSIKSDEEARIKTATEEIIQELDNIDKWYNEWRKQNTDENHPFSAEAKQMEFAKKEDVFGIKHDTDWAKQFFKDENSPNGISKKGNDLQSILGFFSGDGKGLRDIIGDNIIKANPNASSEELAGMMSSAMGTIALIDMIIKAVYGFIKIITEGGRATIDAMKATNKVVSYQKDEYGNAYTQTRYNSDKLERGDKTLETIQTFNQHVMDGWEKVKSGDYVGSFMEIYTSWTDLIKDIAGIADLKTQQKIDELNEANEKLENKINELDFQKDFVAGSDKWEKDAEKLSTYYEEYLNKQKILNYEKSRKNADKDAIQEATEQELETYNKMLTLVREMREELIGTADDLADRLGSAMIEAFRNGENAARKWRNAVKEYMGEVLQDFIIQDWLAPQVQQIMNDWMGGSKEEITKKYAADTDGYLQYMKTRLLDVDALKTANSQLEELGNTFEDALNANDSYINELLFYNSDTSSLSGGIESITEDTARRLEALSNSQLGEMVLIRTLLQNYMLNSGMSGSSFADIQTSLAQMSSNVAMLVSISNAIQNHIHEMRYTSVQPLHVTMV